ncbi:type II toxin-antitoxin system HicA family toxin [bacterium]|nr:type II toxin-antitoxin system HicA family toxin [bacterium]
MTEFPVFTGKKLLSLLEECGFIRSRQKGSHVVIRHPDGRATVVPIHAGETIGPGLLSKILRDTEISRKDLLKLLKKK